MLTHSFGVSRAVVAGQSHAQSRRDQPTAWWGVSGTGCAAQPGQEKNHLLPVHKLLGSKSGPIGRPPKPSQRPPHLRSEREPDGLGSFLSASSCSGNGRASAPRSTARPCGLGVFCQDTRISGLHLLSQGDTCPTCSVKAQGPQHPYVLQQHRGSVANMEVVPAS